LRTVPQQFRGNESNVRPLGSEPSVATSSNHPGRRFARPVLLLATPLLVTGDFSFREPTVGSERFELSPQGLKVPYAAVTPRPRLRGIRRLCRSGRGMTFSSSPLGSRTPLRGLERPPASPNAERAVSRRASGPLAGSMASEPLALRARSRVNEKGQASSL
jgi:hypothetical protein